MAKNKRKRSRSKRRTTRLFNLPNEIINHILSFLPRLNLTNLCLISKFFRPHAERLLYSTVVLKWTEARLPPIISLLLVLVQRPELSGYIDTLSLQGNNPPDDQLPSLKPSPFAVRRLIPIVQKFNLSFTNVWVAKLRSGRMDAYAALLIALLSDTSRLAVGDNFLRSPEFVAQVLQAKAKGLGQLPKFKRLKRIYFVAPGPRQIPEVAVTPFHLQAVTHLAVSLRNIKALHWPDGLTHLTSLDVSSDCATLVAGLLSRTPNLKSFAWEWEYHRDATDVNFDEIFAALLPVKSTLEILQLRVEQFDLDSGEPDLAISGSADALSAYDRITHLDIPLLCLAGVGPEAQPLGRCIPRNVERLSLSTGMLYQEVEWLVDRLEDGVEQTLRDLVSSPATRPPRLQWIKIIDCLGYFMGTELDKMLLETNSLSGDDINVEFEGFIESPWRRDLPV